MIAALRHRLRVLVGLAVALGALAAVPAPSLADCAQVPSLPDALKQAQVAFVGTVKAVARDGRWATVAVEEIWTGPDIPASVLVRGGPESGASSIDRTFQPGVRYLFLPTRDADGYTDNTCTSTQPFTDQVAALRPAAFRVPTGAGTQAGGIDLGALAAPVVVVAVVVAALLVVGLAARGRAD